MRDSLGGFRPVGWYWNGELHVFGREGTVTHIFTSWQVMKDHYEILPPLVGERVFVDDPDPEVRGYYTYDGRDWEYEGP